MTGLFRRFSTSPLWESMPLALTLCGLPLIAWGQQQPVVPPRIEQQGLPLNWRLESLPQRAPQDLSVTGPAIVDQELPSPIRSIDWRAQRFGDEIQALLQPFIGQASISGRALEQARGKIWTLFRQHGSLAQVEISMVGQSATEGGSILRVQVREIRLRAVQVEQEGTTAVSPGVLDDILAGAKAELAEGAVLDLERLDDRIKRRLFLGDVSLHAVLIPAGDDGIDVLLQVSAVPVMPPQWLVQYDNYGTRTYGRNRLTGGAALSAVMLPGDRLNLLATASPGMEFGRLAYEMPLLALGARLAAWTSLMDYRVASGQKGNVRQFGLGLSYPLYFGSEAVWTGYLDYATGQQNGHLGTGLAIDDKRVDSLQARLDANLLLGPAQSAHLSLALRQGRLDLSALQSALAQDQRSARSDGGFTKINADAAWTADFGPAGRFDARAAIKGQAASTNLDQSEKFGLGGPGGVRAYGSAEALGDEGALANVELGVRPLQTLRLYGFYDFGRIRVSRNPWTAGPTPSAYSLRGAGIGLSYSYRTLNGSLIYAHQLGANPGLGVNGLDAEGMRDRYRLWLALTAQF